MSTTLEHQFPAVESLLGEVSMSRELEPRFDITALRGLDAAFQIGDNIVDVRTTEGRELRITAKHDLRTGEYHAEYERLAVVKSGGDICHVWAVTSAHPPFVAADAETCLKRAIEDVCERHLY